MLFNQIFVIGTLDSGRILHFFVEHAVAEHRPFKAAVAVGGVGLFFAVEGDAARVGCVVGVVVLRGAPDDVACVVAVFFFFKGLVHAVVL